MRKFFVIVQSIHSILRLATLLERVSCLNFKVNFQNIFLIYIFFLFSTIYFQFLNIAVHHICHFIFMLIYFICNLRFTCETAYWTIRKYRNIKTTNLLYLLNLASKHFHFGRTKASLTLPSEIKKKI